MQKGNSLRVVIDTNLLISAIITAGSTPDQLLKAWREDRYVLVISKELIEEIKDVSQRDYLVNIYPIFSERVVELIENLNLAAEMVTPSPENELPVHSRDPKDDKLLAAALGGKATYLISGDKDLLDLSGDSALGNIKIVPAKQFLDLI